MADKRARVDTIIAIIKERKRVQISDILTELEKSGLRTGNRTLLRDLTWLLEQGMISKAGSGKSTYYEISESNALFEDIDADAYFEKEYTHRDVYTSFNFDIFSLLKQKLFSASEEEKLLNLHHEFTESISRYESHTLIHKEYERILIEFSWKSSVIEWNTYSLLDTEALIKHNIEDITKTPEETQMILNHKDAFNAAIQNRERFLQLTIGDIEHMHAVLTKKLKVTHNIRKHGVWITGTKYRPLDNEFQIREALEKTVALIGDRSSFFEKAFLALLLISYIQPFEDGNKRTARILSNAILLAHHSVPLSYRVVDPVAYKKATILFYERNSISSFKKIFIDQFEDAVKNYFK